MSSDRAAYKTVVAGLAALAVLSTGWVQVAAKPALIDISKTEGHESLEVLTDGRGHFVVALPMSSSYGFYYGDGKTMYEQRVISGGRNESAKTSTRVFWPRPAANGYIDYKAGVWKVQCDERSTPLTKVDEKRAHAILTKAEFRKPLFEREPVYLARDEQGIYYFVDKVREPEKATPLAFRAPARFKDYRLFIGRKGRMKQQRLIDATTDSRGVVLNVRGAALAVDTKTATMVWTRGRRRTELLFLPARENAWLIYQGLGVYKRMGTPCDDL